MSEIVLGSCPRSNPGCHECDHCGRILTPNGDDVHPLGDRLTCDVVVATHLVGDELVEERRWPETDNAIGTCPDWKRRGFWKRVGDWFIPGLRGEW